jgi:ankyrin repeat protein
MQAGADPAIQNLDGNLPLHYFVSRSYASLQHDFVSMYKFLRVFDRLTGQKTLLNVQTVQRKETPLHYACRKNDTKTNTLLLLKDGADPNITDKYGIPTPARPSVIRG